MPAFIYVSYQCCIAGWFQVILLPVGLFFVCLTANFLIIRNNRKAKKYAQNLKTIFWGYLGKNFKSIVTPTIITYYDDIHITQTRTKNHFILLFFILLKEKIFFLQQKKIRGGGEEKAILLCFVFTLCSIFFCFFLL